MANAERVWRKVIEAIWVQIQLLDNCSVCVRAGARLCLWECWRTGARTHIRTNERTRSATQKQPHIQNGFHFFSYSYFVRFGFLFGLCMRCFFSIEFLLWIYLVCKCFFRCCCRCCCCCCFFSSFFYIIIFTNEKLCLRMLSIRASSRITNTQNLCLSLQSIGYICKANTAKWRARERESERAKEKSWTRNFMHWHVHRPRHRWLLLLLLLLLIFFAHSMWMYGYVCM